VGFFVVLGFFSLFFFSCILVNDVLELVYYKSKPTTIIPELECTHKQFSPM